MSIFGDARDSSRLFEGGARVEAGRQRDFEARRRKAGQDALDRGAALLALFRILPGAVLAAETAEYERIVGRYGEEHPQARELKTSLAHLEALKTIGERGGTRVARAMAALETPGAAFHGFVSDPAGVPLDGMTVRLINLPKELRATTEVDGYFRIGLPAGARVAGPDRDKSEAAGGTGAQASTGTAVVIVDRRGTQIYEDPIPLRIDLGSAYREYVVDVDRSAKVGPREARPKARRGSRKAR